MVNSLLMTARAGDQDAFSELTEPHRHELIVHCYRMMGSIQDAEDAVQETFLRAWRHLETYAERAPFRSWLYKIATNVCLDTLKHQRRRFLIPQAVPATDNPTPDFSPATDIPWLEPLPDELLPNDTPDPEAVYSQQESVTLAFVTVCQSLPPRQRAVLLLRDVLAWRSKEVAELLETTESAVNSALIRARRTLQENTTIPTHQVSSKADELDLLQRYQSAWESANVQQLVALLKEDALTAMPPCLAWYRGREHITAFLEQTPFMGDTAGRWRLLPTQANGQPAFGIYQQVEGISYQIFCVSIITLSQNQIAQMTLCIVPPDATGWFERFGLPSVISTE